MVHAGDTFPRHESLAPDIPNSGGFINPNSTAVSREIPGFNGSRNRFKRIAFH
ncbi:hypothetical protein BN903_7 [Halorubrum sp. AJ67]|nr:hypothetical protein BN903_7 [Halorubrum sp. AJ67]